MTPKNFYEFAIARCQLYIKANVAAQPPNNLCKKPTFYNAFELSSFLAVIFYDKTKEQIVEDIVTLNK